MNTWKRWATVAAAAGSLLWMGVAAADSAMAPDKTDRSMRETGASSGQTDTTAKSEAMTGKISKLDADQRTIELQGHHKLKVDPSTEIRRDGQRASFSDLHEGDDVRASFSGDDHTNVKRIDVLPGSGSSSSDTSSTGSSSMGSSSTEKSSAGNRSTYGGPSGSAAGASANSPGQSPKPSGQ